MSDVFGFIVCTLISFAVLAVVIVMGFRDGDAFGDALVRIRLLRAPRPGGEELFAEIEVDNQNDSPVMVSGRVRRAPLLTLYFGDAHARRTALRHRDWPTDLELLGAVDGRATARFLLPSGSQRARVLRVTVVVDQTGRRTRVISSTVPASHALDGALPTASVTARRE